MTVIATGFCPLTPSTLACPTAVPPPSGQGTKKRDLITNRYGSFQYGTEKVKHVQGYFFKDGRTRRELCLPARGGTRTGKAPQDSWEEHSPERKDSRKGIALKIAKRGHWEEEEKQAPGSKCTLQRSCLT